VLKTEVKWKDIHLTHGVHQISSLVVFDSFCYLHHSEYIVADHCSGICFSQTVHLKKKSCELSLKRTLSGIRHMDNVQEIDYI